MFIKVHKKEGGETLLLNTSHIDVIRPHEFSEGSLIYLVSEEAEYPTIVRESLHEIEGMLADLALIAMSHGDGESARPIDFSRPVSLQFGKSTSAKEKKWEPGDADYVRFHEPESEVV